MHIAEGFLPPVHAAAWTVVAAPFVVHGARAVVKVVREQPNARILLGARGSPRKDQDLVGKAQSAIVYYTSYR